MTDMPSSKQTNWILFDLLAETMEIREDVIETIKTGQNNIIIESIPLLQSGRS